LRFLAKEDGDWRVRLAVAKNSATPAEVLQMMTERSERRDVLCEIGANPHTPADVLMYLAGDEYWPIRKWVATNPSTSSALLIALGKDRTPAVRVAVAGNRSTPRAALDKLLKSRVEEVQNAARENIASRRLRF
jgi:hypothetical protein